MNGNCKEDTEYLYTRKNPFLSGIFQYLKIINKLIIKLPLVFFPG